MRLSLARQGGFTMLEALTVVVIVGLLAAMAIPSMTSMIRNGKLRGASADLFGDLLVARSEAVKQNCNVSVAPITSGTWAGGWQVISNGTAPNACNNGAVVLVQHPALAGDILLKLVPTGAASIVYGSNGRVSAGQQTVIFYESVSGTQARCVNVDASGVPRVALDSNGDASDGCN